MCMLNVANCIFYFNVIKDIFEDMLPRVWEEEMLVLLNILLFTVLSRGGSR